MTDYTRRREQERHVLAHDRALARERFVIEWLLLGHDAYDNHGKVELYRTNPHFKAAIDQLVNMLPAMANGIALEAVESKRKMDEALRLAMMTPSPPLILSDLVKDGLVRGAAESLPYKDNDLDE